MQSPLATAALSSQSILTAHTRNSSHSPHFVVAFTTLPATLLSACGVLEFYRYRCQIELAFKRLNQLLKLGRLPHKAPDIARTWILAKPVVALLLETLYRNARTFPLGATASKPSSNPHRELRPSLWRWTAVVIHALRPALCPPPGLLTLIQATARRELHRVLDEGPPRSRRAANSTLQTLEALVLSVNAYGEFPPRAPPAGTRTNCSSLRGSLHFRCSFSPALTQRTVLFPSSGTESQNLARFSSSGPVRSRL